MKIKMKKDFSDKTIEEGYEEFIRHCKIKNLSESTINYYQMCLDKFSKHYNLSEEIRTINHITVQDYIHCLQEGHDCNAVSINTYLRGLRSILYYFMKLNYLDQFKIQLLKQEQKIKTTYSDAELNILLKKPNTNKCTFSEYRNWVVVCHLLATGNRARTVVNIKIKDLDFESGYIHLTTTKNKKQQVIPMSKKLTRVLTEYLQYRGGEVDSYLFPNQYGKQLTVNGLGQAIRKYNLRRGVTKTSLHLFRHTFAKKWILAGADIFRLQKILGHSSLDIVKEYVNMFSDDLSNDYDKFNALDQISSYRDYITMNK